jgi:hypothetical protein
MRLSSPIEPQKSVLICVHLWPFEKSSFVARYVIGFVSTAAISHGVVREIRTLFWFRN